MWGNLPLRSWLTIPPVLIESAAPRISKLLGGRIWKTENPLQPKTPLPINARLGRWENLFDSGKFIEDEGAVWDKLGYTLANPVDAGLVSTWERVLVLREP